MFTEVSAGVSKVRFPLVSDRTHEISKTYGVLQESIGATYRATFIIDPEGIVASRYINPTEVGRNIYELVRMIQAIQYSKNTGKPVPANWMLSPPDRSVNPKLNR